MADPAAAVLIGVLILWSAGKVLRESTAILLERSPIDPTDLRNELTGIDGVERVDDLHVWQVCSQLTVGTVRLVDSATTIEEREAIRSRVHTSLTERGIDHATIELTESLTSDATHPDRTGHTH